MPTQKKSVRGGNQERSAGGLVLRPFPEKNLLEDSQILMVQVKSLKGEIVWTFPKGHNEIQESDKDAALREVEEETGWRCRIVPFPSGQNFETVRYFFKRGKTLVKKEVVWFLMEPLEKTGSSDPKEIRAVEWVDWEEAGVKVTYPSDKKLLKKLRDFDFAQARSE